MGTQGEVVLICQVPLGCQTRASLKNHQAGHYSHHCPQDSPHYCFGRVRHRRSCPRQVLAFGLNLRIHTLEMEDLCHPQSRTLFNHMAHHRLNSPWRHLACPLLSSCQPNQLPKFKFSHLLYIHIPGSKDSFFYLSPCLRKALHKQLVKNCNSNKNS